MIELCCMLVYLLIMVEILWDRLNSNDKLKFGVICYSVFWIIPFVWMFFKALLSAVHEIVALLLLLLHIKYRKTRVYKWIDNKLNVSGL